MKKYRALSLTDIFYAHAQLFVLFFSSCQPKFNAYGKM